MNARDLYQAGQLGESIASALEEVKRNPTDLAKRSFLCELLCMAGDLARADQQLDIIATQTPQAMFGISLFRQLIRAEQARQQFFSEGRLPEFLGPPSPHLQRHLEASIRLREGKPSEAMQLLHEAECDCPTVKGVCDGQAFDEFRDLDDLTAPFLEVLTTNGKYYWVPLERIEQIEFHKPQGVRDLLWRRTHMIVHDGPDGEVFLPALYCGSHLENDERLRLGRLTEWRGGDGVPVRGIGQRMFLIGDEARSMWEVQEVSFETASEA